MRMSTTIMLVAAASLIASTSTAQQGRCELLLSGGVFNTNQTVTVSTTRERLKFVFCRDEAAQEQRARSIAADLGVAWEKVASITLGGKTAKSSYKEWRSELCNYSDNERDEGALSAEYSVEASSIILKAFNECIRRDGLVQYAEESVEPHEFFWNVTYRPTSKKTIEASVKFDHPDHVHCTINNEPIANKAIDVGPSGLSLRCKRDQCRPAMLLINSDQLPFPNKIFIPSVTAPPIPKAPAPEIFTTPTVDLRAPFNFKLPLGKRCRVQTKNGWFRPHCPREGDVVPCPDLSMREGVADSGEFDKGHYDDNCGSCSYTIMCESEPPSDPWRDHPCRSTDGKKLKAVSEDSTRQ